VAHKTYIADISKLFSYQGKVIGNLEMNVSFHHQNYLHQFLTLVKCPNGIPVAFIN